MCAKVILENAGSKYNKTRVESGNWTEVNTGQMEIRRPAALYRLDPQHQIRKFREPANLL